MNDIRMPSTRCIYYLNVVLTFLIIIKVNECSRLSTLPGFEHWTAFPGHFLILKISTLDFKTKKKN